MANHHGYAHHRPSPCGKENFRYICPFEPLFFPSWFIISKIFSWWKKLKYCSPLFHKRGGFRKFWDKQKLVWRVWRYQRGSQNPYIEEEQTTQWPKEKVQKDKQRSTKHTYKTKDRAARTPLKTRGVLRALIYILCKGLVVYVRRWLFWRGCIP